MARVCNNKYSVNKRYFEAFAHNILLVPNDKCGKIIELQNKQNMCMRIFDIIIIIIIKQTSVCTLHQ